MDDLVAEDRSSPDWQDFALCKGITDVFFGPAKERPERRVERLALARSFCAECPVASICQEQGRVGNEHGIWGGEDEIGRATAGYAPRSPSRRSVIAARDACVVTFESTPQSKPIEISELEMGQSNINA